MQQQQQFQQMKSPMPIQQSRVLKLPGRGVKRVKFKEDNKPNTLELELNAVILTICDSSSYDPLFRTHKQHAPDGSYVAVYTCSKHDIAALQKYHHSNQNNANVNELNRRTDDLKALLDDLSEIDDPLCVAINYECCGGCSWKGFDQMSSQQMLNQLKFFLRCGFVVMYSDFSLKALTKVWHGHDKDLGINPLFRTGEFSGNITLKFNSNELKKSDCAQLQTVADLCQDTNFCTVHCISGTIRYSVKQQHTTSNKNNVKKGRKICHFYGTSKGCKNGKKCKYLHVNQNEKVREKMICSFYNTSKGCRYGDKCKYVHSDNGTNGQNNGKKAKQPYDIKILTVAPFGRGHEKHEKPCSIHVPCKENKLRMETVYGDAGHVILDYSKKKNTNAKESDNEKNEDENYAEEGKVNDDDDGDSVDVVDMDQNELKGQILLSMTHWCELVKLGDSVNEDVLLDVAERNLGTNNVVYKQMRAKYNSFGGKNARGGKAKAKKLWVSEMANYMVQKQSPCNRRTYKKK